MDHPPITFVILLLVFGLPVAAALLVPLAIAGVTVSLAGAERGARAVTA